MKALANALVRVGQMELVAIDVPEYAVAHPDEPLFDPHRANEPCERCLLAIRPDTGELVLLWGAYGDHDGPVHYSLSRETPDFPRHSREIYGRERAPFPEIFSITGQELVA